MTSKRKRPAPERKPGLRGSNMTKIYLRRTTLSSHSTPKVGRPISSPRAKRSPERFGKSDVGCNIASYRLRAMMLASSAAFWSGSSGITVPSAAESRSFHAVGKPVEFVRGAQQVKSVRGGAHRLGLPPKELRPLSILLGAGLRRIGIVSNHTPLTRSRAIG
jgi:hypothetical protein